MGVDSLLQPGQPGPLHIFVDSDRAFHSTASTRRSAAIRRGGQSLSAESSAATTGLPELPTTSCFTRPKQRCSALSLPATGGWRRPLPRPRNGLDRRSQSVSTMLLIQHPDLPMDTFGGKHQYAAYLFAQSVLAALGSPPHSPPGKKGWSFSKTQSRNPCSPTTPRASTVP